MKVVAAIVADLARGPLGTASRLTADLLGEPVLRRTLRRVLQARRVDGVHLVVDPSDEAAARDAAQGLDVAVETHNAGPVPWRSLVASARKWSLDAWRGGIGGATVFDEFTHPWPLDALARREQADAVVTLDAAASLVDPALLDEMVDHHETVRDRVRMTFTQSAPGLAGIVYTPDLLADLVQSRQSIGRVIAYRPAEPGKDVVMQPSYFSPPAAVIRAVGRSVVDTCGAVDRVAALLRQTNEHEGNDGPDAESVSQWLLDHRHDAFAGLPTEIEIELTSEDPLSASTLRPRGEAVGRRGPIDPALFDRLVEELASRDDVRVVLGGFGDPLCHPEWPRLVKRCRDAGVLGVAVRTPAVTLDAPAVDALVDARVDVLNVLLDAASAETYRRVHGADHFDRVRSNLDRVLEAHRRAGRPQPLIVCEMVKTPETLAELETFYDYWVSKTGAAVIAGPSTYGGRRPDRAVVNMAPPARRPCQRLFTRAMVLADGRVTACDQDFLGEHAVGSLRDTSLQELWTGETMTSIRQSHRDATYGAMPLCLACDEWHRP